MAATNNINAGVNWGYASVNDGALSFKLNEASKDALFTVGKDSIKQVQGNRTDVTMSLKQPESGMPKFFCREIKITAAPDSQGVPSGQAAGTYFQKELQDGGGRRRLDRCRPSHNRGRGPQDRKGPLR